MTSKEKNSKARKIVSKNNASKIPVIGYTSWWTIRATEKTAAEMDTLLTSTIGIDWMPKEPSKRKALRNTLDAIEEAGLITKIRADHDVIAYTFHSKIVDKKTIDLNLQKENVLVYDVQAGKLDIRMPHRKDEIKSLFDKYQSIYTDNDLRSIALRYLDSIGAISLRETGGVYFIPTVESRDNLKAFIEQAGCTFYSLPIPDEDAAKMTMYDVAKNELERDVTLAAEEVKQLIGRSNARIGTYESQLERFKTLRAKMEMYRDLLRNDSELMTAQLDSLSDEVRSALAGELEACPQAIKFPYQARVRYTGKEQEKHGTDGTVVGYAPDGYIKVLFDKTETVRNRSTATLQII